MRNWKIYGWFFLALVITCGATYQAVMTSGDQTVNGVKTFGSFPVTPSSAPTTDYQVANKKYVDDTAGAGITAVVDDTSPQLGGDLDINNQDIVSANGESGVQIDITAGNGTSGAGGAINITGGNGSASQAGGNVTLTAGANGAGGDGGSVVLQAGSGSGASNAVTLKDGAGTTRLTIDTDGITATSGTNITEFSTDDTLAGDSDNVLVTEQAIKAYVDSLSSPLTTKGDIYTYSTVGARLPVGTNDQMIVADSTEATGLKWVDFQLVRDGTPTLGGNLIMDGNNIVDGTSNELLEFTATASAVNHVKITNNTSGNDAIISAVGDDANIDLALIGKGIGNVEVQSLLKCTSSLVVTDDAYTVDSTDYFATSTKVGWTTPSGTIYYRKLGKTVHVWFDIAGTSNATNITFTLPYANNSNVACSVSTGFSQDNGTVNTTPSRVNLPTSSSTVNVYKDSSSGAWTASGTKRIIGTFTYFTD